MHARLLLMLTCLLAPSAGSATTIFDNLSSGGLSGTVITSDVFGGGYEFASSFPVLRDPYRLDRIELMVALLRTGGPNANELIVSILSASPVDASPDRLIERFHLVDRLGVTGSEPDATLVTVESIDRPVLQPGVYWVALSAPADRRSVTLWRSASRSGFVAERYVGDPWRTYVGGAGGMRITGTLVPEPGAIALCGLGLAALSRMSTRPRNIRS